MITVYPDVNRDYSLQTTDEFSVYTFYQYHAFHVQIFCLYFFLKPNIARGALVNHPPPLSRHTVLVCISASRMFAASPRYRVYSLRSEVQYAGAHTAHRHSHSAQGSQATTQKPQLSLATLITVTVVP